jgi:predicted nucleic acid-binding protein
MRLLLDTNIFLEVILKQEREEEAQARDRVVHL